MFRIPELLLRDWQRRLSGHTQELLRQWVCGADGSGPPGKAACFPAVASGPGLGAADNPPAAFRLASRASANTSPDLAPAPTPPQALPRILRAEPCWCGPDRAVAVEWVVDVADEWPQAEQLALWLAGALDGWTPALKGGLVLSSRFHGLALVERDPHSPKGRGGQAGAPCRRLLFSSVLLAD